MKKRDTAYFDDGLEMEDVTHFRRCMALWNAVLLQLFTDMSSHTSIPRLVYEKYQAENFLTHYSNNLHVICDFVGMDVKTVITRALRAKKEDGLHWRQQPTKGQDYATRIEYKKQKDKERRAQHRSKINAGNSRLPDSGNEPHNVDNQLNSELYEQ